MRRWGARGTMAVMVAVLGLVRPAAAPTVIVFEKGQGGYEIAVLDRALAATKAEYGAYELRPLGQSLSENRAIAVLNEGGFDVTYMALSAERERQVLPVRYDISRGTLGYRLLLTRRDVVPRLKGITTLEALRTQFAFGFGAQWADLAILTGNGFRVVTSTDPQRLYTMLERGRFDLFPRALNEVWGNLESNRGEAPNMVVADHIALIYPLVQCFVVSKRNTELAARITLGLQRLVASGALKTLFFQAYGAGLERANVTSRRVFWLENPNRPRGGPGFETTWWLGK